jgi:hypothetical protein
MYAGKFKEGPKKWCATHDRANKDRIRRKRDEEQVARNKRNAQYKLAWAAAVEAGRMAHENPRGTGKDDTEKWILKGYENQPFEPFGGAYVTADPGTHSFCRWAKANAGWRKGHPTGCVFPILIGSAERTDAQSRAMAKVLREHLGAMDERVSIGCRSYMD